jgi:hypothetical protein
LYWKKNVYGLNSAGLSHGIDHRGFGGSIGYSQPGGDESRATKEMKLKK